MPIQVLSEFLKCKNYPITLLFRSCIISLRFVKYFACKRDHFLFPSVIDLRQHCTNARVARVRTKNEGFSKDWMSEDQILYDCRFHLLKRFLSSWGPFK